MSGDWSPGRSYVRLIRLFVSSPGDVAAEREALDQVVQRINRLDGPRCGVRIETWKWERDAVPQIGPPPQAGIDRQLPSYDVYLGVMSTRFGTPTDGYGSGTEKEFRDALTRWQEAGTPWILFYFDEAPQLTGQPEDALQYVQVCQFRQQLETLGLVGTYRGVRGSDRAFFETTEAHLRGVVAALAAPAAIVAEPDSPESEANFPDAYRQWLKKECGGVGLLGLQDQRGRTVELYQVYVPLTTAAGDRRQEGAAEKFELRAEQLGERELEREQRPLDLLLKRAAQRSLFLSGAAGTGKSTFCRWLAYLVAHGEMPEVTPLPPEELREEFPDPLRESLPLLVRLRDFWSALPPGRGRRELSAAQLQTALDGWLDEKQSGGLGAACTAAHREAGRLLLMLDGFDEVPISSGSGAAAWYPRAMLLSALAEAVPAWTAAGNRVLVTSRPYGLSESEAGELGLETARIAELHDPLRRMLVRRWFGVLSPDKEENGSPADEMLSHIAARGELAPLVANPMLLTAMCVIFNQGKRLPRDKHELYHRILDNVLYNRYLDAGCELPLIRNRLSVIAYGMHTGTGLDEDRPTPQAEATYAELEQMIERYQDESPAKEARFRGAVETREDLLSRSGILLPRPGERAGFYHFTFQDFLAAQLILEREDDLAAFFRQRAVHEQWRGTLSFVFSSLMSRNTLPDKGIRLLEKLIEPLTVDDLPLALVVSDCLEILTGLNLGLQEQYVQSFREVCFSAIDREVEIGQRVELAHALGRVGDPRVIDDLRRHDNPRAWCEVPVGKYPVGGGEAPSDIKPLKKQQFRVAEPFRITRYSVTNSQFAVFVQEDGYKDRQWWPDAGWQWREKGNIVEPWFWHDATWNGPNQPVVGVSFWEAEAFCRWAGGRLAGEREWEAAARGPQGNEYPWGEGWQEGVCNIDEMQLGRTSPVGIFPTSRSQPFELDDAAGNVWEWCVDEVDVKGYGVCRVVRGGSWCNPSLIARCGFRYGRRPGCRNDYVGFRLCVCFSPGLAKR